MSHRAADAELGYRDLQTIAAMMEAITGIRIDLSKREHVQSRMARRIRELSLPGLPAYIERLTHDVTGQEHGKLIDALTVNQTSFFRDASHFDLLRTRILPEACGTRRTFCVWSAGCSTGEEPYTIAMIARDVMAEPCGTRILATDISVRALEVARSGLYDESAIQPVPESLRRRMFERQSTPEGQEKIYRISSPVRALVNFARLNLLEEWPMSGPFDAIFCRKEMFYFDQPTRAELVARYANLLAPGGYLFVGMDESLVGMAPGYKYVEPGAYRRC